MSAINEPASQEATYIFKSYDIGILEGTILTFIDASISDPVQRKALKDLLRPMVWKWAIENNLEYLYDSSLKEEMLSMGSTKNLEK